MAEKPKTELAPGEVLVTAKIDGVSNHGKTFAKGATFPMERSLAEAHAKAGQVDIAAA